MLIRIFSNMLSNLAVALVMLFSGLQLVWAFEALQQASAASESINREFAR
ncbi:MAG: hypothetical protein GY953_32410 [bacterium]|nr:hypothetical protein [bacterium]